MMKWGVSLVAASVLAFGATDGWRYDGGNMAETGEDLNNYTPAGVFQDVWQAQLSHLLDYHTLRSGDVDGDGKNEIVVLESDTVHIFDHLGNQTQFSVHDASRYIVLEDIDEDGDDEILIGAHNTSSAKVVIYDADGTALKTLPGGTSDSFIFPIAYLGSGKVVVGNHTGYGLKPRGLSLWDISGEPVETWHYAIGPAGNYRGSVADMDGDGVYEMIPSVSTTHNGNSGSGIDGTATTTTDGDLYMILTDESGQERLTQMTGENTSGGANGGGLYYLSDMDGDGQGEILALIAHGSNYYGGESQVRIYDQNGNEKYRAAVGESNDPLIASADLDNDGKKEVVISDLHYDKLRVLDSTLTMLSESEAGSYEYALKISDVNGDGKKEILAYSITDEGKGKIVGLDASLNVLWEVEASKEIIDFIPSDIDGDGAAELVYVDADYQLHYLDGDGTSSDSSPVNGSDGNETKTYEEGYAAGIAFCAAQPEACGLAISGGNTVSSVWTAVADMEDDGAYLLDIDGSGLAEASQVCYESSEQRAFLGYALQYQGYNSKLGIVRLYRDADNQPVLESYSSIYTTNWGSGDLGSHYVEKDSSYYPSGTFDRTTFYAGTWLEGFNDETMFVSPTVEGLADAIGETFTVCENTASSNCNQSGSYALHITIQEGIRTYLESTEEETSSCTPELPEKTDIDSTNETNTLTSSYIQTLPSGWNLVGTCQAIADMSVFDEAKIIWNYKDGWNRYDVEQQSWREEGTDTLKAFEGFWLKK